MKKNIDIGHTNISYQDGDLFVQQKVLNKFNHKINYEILQVFDFVPKLISQTDEELKWEFINGHIPQVNNNFLITLAQKVKIVHDSKLTFPKFNISDRIKEYRQIMKDKGIKIPIIHNYYKRINYILKHQDKSTPIHSDIWDRNLIESNDKLFLVDWEYAHMGDRHFELAYIIQSFRLNEEQEQLFLNEYDNYSYQFIKNHKELVNYLIILWNNAQEVKHFSDDEFIANLEKYEQERQEKRT